MDNIYINGRFLAQPFTGVQRFATEMLRALDAQLPGWPAVSATKWTVLVPRGTRSRLDLKNIAVSTVGNFRGALWEQLDLPRFVNGDLLINLGSTGPLLHGKQIVTMHDAEVVRQPDNFRLAFRLWYRFLLPQLARRAQRIVTVSEFSKRELGECFGVPPGKCSVIHNSAEHIDTVEPDSTILRRFDIPDGQYVLCFGAGKRNKNSKSVIRAMELIDDLRLHLVLVGKTDADVFQSEFHTGAIPLHEVGRITDAELRALYEHAMCFVFPSLYEGFGIPPIEAMSCGCPVIASNMAAIPEVCGDAAMYLAAVGPKEIAAAICSLSEDPERRSQMIAAGLLKVKQYNWKSSAERFLHLVQLELTPQSVSASHSPD